MNQKEEYLYIIKNHDIQKLINNSNLPESDKNVIKEKVLSKDTDLSEKLKILNYLLKYQRSEHYRGEVILDEETGFEREKNLTLEPGYYLLEMNGGNAGCVGSQKDDMPNLKEFTDHKSIYNFVIQDSRFYNVEDETESLFFTTNFKWHLFTATKYLQGSFELNSKGVFLHLEKEYRKDSGYNFNESINQSSVPKSLIANLDKSYEIVHNQKFYDYSGLSLDPLNFNSEYKTLNFKKIGKFKSVNQNHYEPFSVMECFGIPLQILDDWNNGNLDITNYPKYKEFIEQFVNKKVDSTNSSTALPVSCTEKEFPKNIYLNRNKPAGGAGGKLIKVLKVNKVSICGYKIGKSGISSFNEVDVENGSDTIFRVKDKNDSSKSIYLAKAEGGFATLDGKTRKNDTNNDKKYINKTWIDGVNLNSFKVEKNDISFNVGEKSFLEDNSSSLDYFSGRSFISYNKDQSDVEIIDDFETNNIFYGSDIKGQGCHLNDYENTYYQDEKDGFIRITFLGPQSSEKCNIVINCDDSIISTSKKFDCPSSATTRFEIKLDSQKKTLNLKSSKITFSKDNETKEISVFDLYRKTDVCLNNEDFKFTDLKITKKNEYYIFEFKVIKNLSFELVSTDENRFLLYDENLIGNDQEVLSINSDESSNELLTINGSSIGTKNVRINYKNNDYSFDSYLTSLYNHERLDEEFDGLKRFSKLSFNNNHNIFIPFNGLYKKIQVSFNKGNSFDLEKVRNLNNEVILKDVPEAGIKSIEYCFSLDEELKPATEAITVVPNQVIYIKVTFNTFRIRISKILSGLQAKQTLYPLNFDIKTNSMNENLNDSIQWLKYICNDYSEKVVLNIERNNFKLKQKIDLYNLIEYKTVDNKEEYEYGEEVVLTLNLKKEHYLSLRNVLQKNTPTDKDQNDYLINCSEHEVYESSILVGKCENTIRFGLKEQYSENQEFGTFIELLKGEMVTSRYQNSKPNVFFTTLDKGILTAYPDSELIFIKFKMPQNNLSLRLTCDFNPSSKILNSTSGSDSYVLNKSSYCRLISSGGNTGKGGNGGSSSSMRVECRSGGCGASGFIGGGGGNGSSTTDWSPYWEMPTFDLKSTYTHKHIIKLTFTFFRGYNLSVHWRFGLRDFPPGPPGAGASGFLDGGAAGKKGAAAFESKGKLDAFPGSDDQNGSVNYDEGFSIFKKGHSFDENYLDLSKYRGRIIDVISLIEKVENNKSSSISGICGINGADGSDSVGSPNEGPKCKLFKEEFPNEGIGGHTYTNAVWHYAANGFGGESINTQPGIGIDGTAMSGGAPSSGLPSLISTSNSNIIFKKFKDTCLINMSTDITQNAIVVGGGVDGAVAVMGEPHSKRGEDWNATWNVKCWDFDIFHPKFGDEVVTTVHTYYCLKICERYKGTGDAYLPYILLPLVDGFDSDSDKVEYPFYRDPITKKYSSGAKIFKVFGNGGGKMIKKVSRSKDFKVETWLGAAGSIGTLDSMYKSILSQSDRNITVFPPSIVDEIMSLNLKNSKIKFNSYDDFFKSIEKIQPISNLKSVEKPNNAQCNNFKKILYRTPIGDCPNNNPLVRAIYLGPKHYNKNSDSESITLTQIMSSSNVYLERNWYYLFDSNEAVVDEF